MAESGYSPLTKTYHSLLPAVPLPPISQPLSVSSYTISLLRSPTTPTSAALSTTTFLIDAATGHCITFTAFLQQVSSLSSSLKSILSKNDVAFILSPPSTHIPILYFSLLALGVVISPANPISSPSEIKHQIQLSKPAVAFATAETRRKLPPNIRTILLDSAEFLTMLEPRTVNDKNDVVVRQTDSAAILYSSGTTGRVKGVVLTHRNLISVIGGFYHSKLSDVDENRVDVHPVSLFTIPLFHVFGFFMLIRAASLGESLVLMEKFDFLKMLEAVERYKVTYIPVAPPLVVALAKSELVDKYDLSSLRSLGCGGAALGKEVSERFRERFPNVEIHQGYGMTETAGGATRTTGPEETKRYGSAGRLAENMEAKIVDPESGEALPPGKRGELWLRGPAIMKGYAGDDAATAATLDSEGWLKTGDLCYFDSEGFLFIVDRLKELIKYKAYQVNIYLEIFPRSYFGLHLVSVFLIENERLQVPPAELEHLLQSIPEIVDAAVIPYPDDEAGEIPMAYVVRKPGSTISATQIMDSVAKQVAPYKKIRRVAFINSIPKSPAGKILRRELVNYALSSSPSSKL